MRTRSPSTESVPLESALEVTQRSANGHLCSGQNSTDDDTDSEEESSADDRYWPWSPWDDARFQGTLPLILSARIPLEVFGLIINETDQPTSAAAALVCTAWYSRAMRVLYHEIQINDRTSFDMLSKQCRASPRVKRWLATTHELVAKDNECVFRTIARGPPFLQVLPIALVHAMPGVRTLDIAGGDLRFVRPAFLVGLSHFKAVTSLFLRECNLNNIEQLRRIVFAFPKLTDLSITHISLTQQLRGPACNMGATLVQSPRLRRLRIDLTTESMATFVDCMTRSGCLTSLEELTPLMDSRYEYFAHAMSKALEAAGASLTLYHEQWAGNECETDGKSTCQLPPDLAADAHAQRTMYVGDDHGILSQNTALRSLEFTMNDINPDIGDRALLWWVNWVDELYGVLSNIRSPDLERIKIQSNLGYNTSDHDYKELDIVLKKVDFVALHEVMGRSYFDVLEDVEVEMGLIGVMDDSIVDDVGRKLRRVYRGLLRPWSDRGIVSVTRWI
ncbi:uncharacterized protein B0H18DRAFT_537608 [Fomitopsis serialis]|uniref:uncharacterized protein n=1 Tax=Fomitopsis serialis TaxID=139415 RepID=UPI002007A192|nr:uncharacterized protein B0H18DRAFT_537608 [Neoantrodia serialis]KAH9921780.1 hypothetical protein B0H18DRAFT_537608 [Neoantrodia serialis]